MKFLRNIYLPINEFELICNDKFFYFKIINYNDKSRQ